MKGEKDITVLSKVCNLAMYFHTAMLRINGTVFINRGAMRVLIGGVKRADT